MKLNLSLIISLWEGLKETLIGQLIHMIKNLIVFFNCIKFYITVLETNFQTCKVLKIYYKEFFLSTLTPGKIDEQTE